MAEQQQAYRPRVFRQVVKLLTRMGRHELGTLVLLLCAAGSVWGFLELADEVMEGTTRAADQYVLLALRGPEDSSDPVGPEWFEEVMRDWTALGSFGVLTFVTLAVAGFLLLQGKYRATLFLLLAIGGGVVISQALKSAFDRPRPDLVPHEARIFTASFPSGHSTMAAITYLTLGALLARLLPQLRMKAYVLLLAILMTFWVGATRVYLGVHWPSDVLAGWTVGAGWALLCWALVLWLQRRHELETDQVESQKDEG